MPMPAMARSITIDFRRMALVRGNLDEAFSGARQRLGDGQRGRTPGAVDKELGLDGQTVSADQAVVSNVGAEPADR